MQDELAVALLTSARAAKLIDATQRFELAGLSRRRIQFNPGIAAWFCAIT